MEIERVDSSRWWITCNGLVPRDSHVIRVRRISDGVRGEVMFDDLEDPSLPEAARAPVIKPWVGP